MGRTVSRRSVALAVTSALGFLALGACDGPEAARSADLPSRPASTVPQAAEPASPTTTPTTTTTTTTTTSSVPSPRPRPTTAPTPVPSAVPPSGDIRSVDFLDGFTYDLGELGELTVRGGQAQRGASGSPDIVSFVVAAVTHGDLNGDGDLEAALSTEIWTGGTGRFTSVWVYDLRDGAPVRVATTPVGDRGDGGVFDVAIDGGHLVVDNFAEPQGACCPTALTRVRYLLGPGGVVEVDRSLPTALVSLQAPGQPVTFRPGTSTAALWGHLGTPRSLSLSAAAGQRLVLEPRTGSLPLTAVLTDSTGARIAAGAALDAVLPALDRYVLTLTAAPGAPVDSTDVKADLTIS